MIIYLIRVFYIKKITKQDETRTPLVSKKAVSIFFNKNLFDRNDSVYIQLTYINTKKEILTQIKKKQDYRIYLEKDYLEFFFEGNILVYHKKEEEFTLKCFNRYHEEYMFFDSLITSKGNNLLLEKLTL